MGGGDAESRRADGRLQVEDMVAWVLRGLRTHDREKDIRSEVEASFGKDRLVHFPSRW